MTSDNENMELLQLFFKLHGKLDGPSQLLSARISTVNAAHILLPWLSKDVY